ncbi:hypothetical protein CTI12_AA408970 [Artemisia annua]|uniref:Uncharacterized protein n=1 Tax=Artemisia annua TaxID=35608 RepID=A0A2U1M888_ARTAN|nr:hypothetical protein CTI12_AA408970 [Artemisia annua]
MASSTKMSLKLIIDKKEERVLFAEAGKDFIDFLFSFLTLPIGPVLGFLDGDNILLKGGLPKLNQSVKDLDKKYINPNHEKDVILKPKPSVPYLSRLSLVPLMVHDEPTITYRCLRTGCNKKTTSRWFDSPTTSSDLDEDPRVCPTCYRNMAIVDEGGFVNGTVMYMVMDDLVVSPMSTISTSIACLNKHNIKDFGALEEKVVYVGKDEAYVRNLE